MWTDLWKYSYWCHKESELLKFCSNSVVLIKTYRILYLVYFTISVRSLREALCTSGVAKYKLSVRPLVTKIIGFCEVVMRGVRTLRSLDETQQRFLATSKVDPHLTRLATGKRTFRDPFLDPVLVTFSSKVNKNLTDPDYNVSRLQMDTK